MTAVVGARCTGWRVWKGVSGGEGKEEINGKERRIEREQKRREEERGGID